MEPVETPIAPPSKRQKISATAIYSPNHRRFQLDGATDARAPLDTTQSALDGHFASDEQIQRELAAGISVYICPQLPGFEGLLKKRYTDFLVNEILPNGRVLHLQTLKVPKIQHVDHPAVECRSSEGVVAESKGLVPQQTRLQLDQKTSSTKTQEKTWQANTSSQHSHDHGKNILHSIFKETTVTAIQDLYERIINNPHRKASNFWPVTTEAISDKELRTDAHKAIREIFQSKLESQTTAEDTILVTIAPVRSKARGGDSHSQNTMQRGSLSWAELGGQWLHFTLFKENKDTMEVVYFLASQTKMNVKQFQFGGTKDRRAVTVQRASAYRLRAEKLASIGQKLRQAKVGDFKYEQTSLQLGELAGNEFVITLRECHLLGQENVGVAEDVGKAHSYVTKLVNELKDKGFLNYYGLQRFGSFTTGTDIVGKRLLQGNLKAAVEAILDFNPHHLASPNGGNYNNLISSDDKNRAEAINIWNTTGDSNEALQKLPRKFSAESNIIRHLGTRDKHTHLPKSNDFQGALSSIARNLRLMYVHAYQSLVWNSMASRRWELYGGRVVPGDLVLVHEHRSKESKSSPERQIDEEGETIVRPVGDNSAADPTEFIRARALSEEEASSGLYTIFDIVLPLPGFDVLYPQNAIEGEYKTFMASERGGGLDPYDMRRPWKDLSLSGSYRKILARPANNMSFEFRFYNDDDEQLVKTDLDQLQDAAQSSVAGCKEPRSHGGESDLNSTKSDPHDDQSAPQKLAIVLRMQLGSSQYATMALRELMKKGLKTYKPDFSGGR